MRIRRKITIAVALAALRVSVERLVHVGNQLRDRLSKSGRVEVVGVAAVAAQALAVDLRTCAWLIRYQLSAGRGIFR